MEIAIAAGVHTRSVKQLLAGCTFATPTLAYKLIPVLTVYELKLVTDARSGHLPYQILSPLIEQAVAKYGVEGTASLTGIPSRRLLAMRSGEARVVRLGVADRIILGLATPMLWWSNRELRRWAFATTAGV